MPAKHVAYLNLFLLFTCHTCAGAAETKLLFFFFSGEFGPCLQMHVVAEQLAAEGYSVEKIDVGKTKQQAEQFGVESIPCFVIVKEKETKRVAGVTSKAAILNLLEPDVGSVEDCISFSREKRTFELPADDCESVPPEVLKSRILQATVRIGVIRGNTTEYGSGTVVQSDTNGSLIVTCAHIFKAEERDRICVTSFGGEKPQTSDAQLLACDFVEDVGIVVINNSLDVEPIRIAPTLSYAKKGQNLFAAGCDGGGKPSLRSTRITVIHQVKTTPNLRTDAVPEHGRSGGGLFTPNGMLVGVCSGRDFDRTVGIYASLRGVYSGIEKSDIGSSVKVLNNQPTTMLSSPNSPPRP